MAVRDLYSGYFRDVNVLRKVSMSVYRSSVTCVVGPNGSGKSTLLKTIFGYLKPFHGRIIHEGVDVTGLKPHDMLRRGVSYVSQNSGVFPHLTVDENLMAGLWLFRRNKNLVRERIRETYSRFPGLEQKKNEKAGNLSGGQQKLLQIAKTLLTNPSLVLMDEPSAGLSPKILEQVFKTIKLLRDEGKTILLVEQNVTKALSVADYVYMIELGQNKFSGTREEFERKLPEILPVWGFRL
ncbi:MAG: ABC transporter ATP-binding protein [Candidatus Caldarchaeum sp.]